VERSKLIQQRRKRGEQIFRRLLQKYIKNRFDSEEEEKYIRKLIEASDYFTNMFREPIPRWKFYIPLERAERTGGIVTFELADKGKSIDAEARWIYRLVVRKQS